MQTLKFVDAWLIELLKVKTSKTVLETHLLNVKISQTVAKYSKAVGGAKMNKTVATIS